MEVAINTIRFLALEMIERANSGHPGIVLDFAPTFYVLFTRHLVFSRTTPTWINRDRLILSAGHGSALLYATLYLTNSGLTIQDLKSFRQIGSKTPGHPELNQTLGIETTTGPLGQGIANGVGMAIAEAVLSSKFNQPHCQLIDHFTYVVCGDGCLQEGISYEATNLAGTLQLKKLILLYDSNHMQLDGPTCNVWVEQIEQRFGAINWHYQRVSNGNDIEAIDRAITQARLSDRPSIIEINTIIGEGSTDQNTANAHGRLLGPNLARVKKYYHYQWPPFKVNPQVVNHFQKLAVIRGERQYQAWVKNSWQQLSQQSEQLKIFNDAIKRKWNYSDLIKHIVPPVPNEPTRVSSGKILQQICRQIPTWIGGGADLGSSCQTPMGPMISHDNYNGTAIWYGVREHAMVAINSGISLHGGLFPFGATFLVFSDYARGAIRLAAMMHNPMLLIFTHDSVLVGQDGPTHQPTEQLAGLRSIPNLYVLRPADFTEVWGCYQILLNEPQTTYAMILTRQATPQLTATNAQAVRRGGYVVYRNAAQTHDIIIFASGSELVLAIAVAKKLHHQHQLTTKVISLVCFKLLTTQPVAYQNQLQDQHQAFTVSLELGSTYGWKQWANLTIGYNQFGLSGTIPQIKSALKWDEEHITQTIVQHFAKWKAS